MLKLSSYERMRRYLTPSPGANEDEDRLRSDNYWNKRQIENQIVATSKQIEKYLHRELEIKERTQYFNVDYNDYEFWPDAYPIESVSSVKEDIEGRYAGNESTLGTTEYHTGQYEESVVLNRGLPYTSKKGLQVVYTGGLAYDGVKSTFVVASTISFTSNTWVSGSTSSARGIINTVSTNTLIVENIQGIFEEDETIVQYNTDESSTTETANTTISQIAKQSLAEKYPDIVQAAEMEMRYKLDHKNDFEATGTLRDGTNVRRTGTKRKLPFTLEVYEMLKEYRKPVL